jgi:hypothetical protein
MYAGELGRKYSGLKPDLQAQQAGVATLPEGETEQVFTTSEGPVVITTRGKLVFVAESFPLDLARKLTEQVLDAQGTGALKMAKLNPPPAPSWSAPGEFRDSLTGSLVRFMSSCGVMKAAVDAAAQTGK